jgi:hypothetical protein
MVRARLSRVLLLTGSAFLLMVVLAHVAEHFKIMPSMGWGLPDSPGHYIDLFSAIAGVGLLLSGVAIHRRST